MENGKRTPKSHSSSATDHLPYPAVYLEVKCNFATVDRGVNARTALEWSWHFFAAHKSEGKVCCWGKKEVATVHWRDRKKDRSTTEHHLRAMKLAQKRVAS
ncbi:hypothetical protein ABVK25_002538 [Lepraria finkii]|uniref:Uncharacterized protein n=1 Tax=Lepraria finkii TaxID=1340010 RepID=A0ABR4BI39_9LECA